MKSQVQKEIKVSQPGRPPQNGIKPISILFRNLRVIGFYNQARSSGLKHSSAVTETVELMESVAKIAISETSVRRILAEYQPKGSHMAFRLMRIPDAEVQQDLARYRAMADQAEALGYPELMKKVTREIAGMLSKLTAGFEFGFGPRIEHPRINARSPKSTSPQANS